MNDLDLSYYLKSLEEAQNSIINVEPISYEYPVVTNVKGYMHNGKFYTVEEYLQLSHILEY